MKKKNLALRMSACIMSALLVVGSVAPAYAAEDMVFADQAVDVSEDVADAECEAEDVLTLESSLTGGGNCTCRIIDSSSEKTGKIAVEQYFYNGNAENAILILDGITCEVPVVQAISTGKLYVTNGTKVIGAALLNPFMGGGSTYIQDSSRVIAQKAKELNDAIAKLQALASAKSITALKSAITAAKKLKSTDYTATSFKTYTAAIATAEKVLKVTDLSEAQVTAATKALTAAKAKLVKMKTQTITISVKNSNGVVSKKYGEKPLV